ncbi:hypothetical protein GDO78_013578 [Eleutherodactylus coqui]|uniref:Uncharacterized protein n=1 Tax=Eleutherodactylus coqui TaxID=57060 RepID=A0A8J6ER03_ELECQ|nr:hypothetical protein GDO78_013578 [Eleutherodactylus coqui]
MSKNSILPLTRSSTGGEVGRLLPQCRYEDSSLTISLVTKAPCHGSSPVSVVCSPNCSVTLPRRPAPEGRGRHKSTKVLLFQTQQRRSMTNFLIWSLHFKKLLN